MALTVDMQRSLRLGAVVSFRYGSPTAHDRTPMVLILTPRDDKYGNVHGLNTRYMNYQHVQQLYWFFNTPFEQQQQADPFAEKEFQQQQQYKQAQERREELQRQQSQVVLKPDPQQLGGSPFKTKTFGPTPAVSQPFQTKAHMGLKLTDRLGGMAQNQNLPWGQTQEGIMARERSLYFGKMNSFFGGKNRVINDPYAFYYEYVKPLIGPNSYAIAKVYRQYKWNYIKNMRIVHAVQQ